MYTNYHRAICLELIFMLVAIFETISQRYVEGLQSQDIFSFGPKLKGTVKTVEALECGDIIDCVDFYKQPAFDNPHITDLKIEHIPYPTRLNQTRDPEPNLLQTWRKYGECPRGTIPIRRTLDNNSTFRRKNIVDPDIHHEYASVHQYFNKGQGGKAFLNVWNPRVEAKYEFSLSQVWISSGPDEELNTVEAGWMVRAVANPGFQVLPALFRDTRTRLFTYWTSDDYKETGCYNLKCTGFVQTNHEIALGSALEPVSVYDGDQITLLISLSMGPGGNWWLEVGQDLVGYFPGEIFTYLIKGADEVSFGGEIINLKKNSRHTSTTMGSGRFSGLGNKKSSFISNIKVAKNRYEWVEPDLKVQDVTNPGCYDLTFGPSGTYLGSHFYFGGPGYSKRCK